MDVIITGATGFIGKALCRNLVNARYDVVALSRDPSKGSRSLGSIVKVVEWDGKSAQGWGDYADGAYAIINLTGESISSGR